MLGFAHIAENGLSRIGSMAIFFIKFDIRPPYASPRSRRHFYAPFITWAIFRKNGKFGEVNLSTMSKIANVMPSGLCLLFRGLSVFLHGIFRPISIEFWIFYECIRFQDANVTEFFTKK